jgi:site-specific DNA-methyltransferase (adenine-specific)
MGQGYARAPKGEAVFDDAKQWDGWGTALKPAHEPIALARKPFSGTVTDTVLAHGTGGINIAAARIAGEDLGTRHVKASDARGSALSGSVDGSLRQAFDYDGSAGRWPANVMTDGSLDVLEAFPSSARDAIRFFYSAKAGRDEREFGMADVAPTQMAQRSAHDRDRDRLNRNVHPTVKPIDLMRWLCRLLTPPGGTVLEPFMGSGSTGIAAVREGLRFVGVEQSPEYFDIARRRIAAAVAERATTPTLFAATKPRAAQLAFL